MNNQIFNIKSPKRNGKVTLSYEFTDTIENKRCYSVYTYEDDEYIGLIKFGMNEQITESTVQSKINKLYQMS